MHGRRVVRVAAPRRARIYGRLGLAALDAYVLLVRRAPDCASVPGSWRGVTLDGDGFVWYRSCRARYSDSSSVLSLYPAAAEDRPRGAGLPERRCSGYCSLAVWYCSSVTGSSQVVPSPPEMPSSMARWHMKLPAGAPCQGSSPGGV